jgi:thiamine biosynthesis lipoprotein
MKRFSPFFLLIAVLSSCNSVQKYTYRKFVVGAISEIIFYAQDDSTAQQIIDECDEELTRLHTLLNRFSDSSLVSRLNREYRVAAPSDIITLVKLCDSISYITNGLFDITIAPYMELWGYYQHEYGIPDSHQLKQARQYVNYRHIKTTKDSIFIAPNMQIDLGGIAQGYAADRIALILHKYGINAALVNIGGEVVAIGRSPEHRSWNIGIKHPRQQGIIETVEIENAALSTSGDYEKFFIIENKRYPHIIDPTTGFPAQQFASVTIVHGSAAFADAIATAVAIMGPDRGVNFLDSCGIQGILYYESDSKLQRRAYP